MYFEKCYWHHSCTFLILDNLIHIFQQCCLFFCVSEFGQALLQCLGCLLPFLENDMIDTLPYLTASTIAVLPAPLHQEIVNQLCYYVFPFTLSKYFLLIFVSVSIDIIECEFFLFIFFLARRTHEGQENYASHSVAAILMLVFQYAENSGINFVFSVVIFTKFIHV